MRDKIRLYIVDNFLFGDSQDFDESSSLLKSGVVDSTGVLEIVSFLESEFSIKIKDEELIPEHLDSIDNMLLFLETKLGAV